MIRSNPESDVRATSRRSSSNSMRIRCMALALSAIGMFGVLALDCTDGSEADASPNSRTNSPSQAPSSDLRLLPGDYHLFIHSGVWVAPKAGTYMVVAVGGGGGGGGGGAAATVGGVANQVGGAGGIRRRRHHQRRGHAGGPAIPDLGRQRRHSGRRRIRQRRFRRAGGKWRCLQFSRRCLRRRRHRRTRWTREQQLDRPGSRRRGSLEPWRYAGTRFGGSGNRNCRGTIGVLVPVCLAGGRWRRSCRVGPRRQRRRCRRRQRHHCSGWPRRCHDRNIGGNGFDQSDLHQWSRWWRRWWWCARRHGRLRRSGSRGLPRHHRTVVLTLLCGGLCGGGEMVPVGTEAESIHGSDSWSSGTSGARDVCLNHSLEFSSGPHEHP